MSQRHIDLYNKLKIVKAGFKNLPKYIQDAEFGYIQVKYHVKASYGLSWVPALRNKYDLYELYMSLILTAPRDLVLVVIRNDKLCSQPKYLKDLISRYELKYGT